LFIFEGLHHAAVYLYTCDEEEIRYNINNDYKEPKLSTVSSTVSFLRIKFAEFIAGRQICVLVIVVLIAKCIEHLPVPDNSFVFNVMSSKYVLIGTYTIHDIAYKILNSFIIALALSTLLPCWLAQILPEMLAQKRSIWFTSLWLCLPCTRVAIYINDIGATWPGQFIFNTVKNKYMDLQRTEDIRTGKSAIFERASSSIGHRISRRVVDINVNIENITVEDACSIEYISGSRTYISHVLRVFPSAC
jgi:hypothetical protein